MRMRVWLPLLCALLAVAGAGDVRPVAPFQSASTTDWRGQIRTLCNAHRYAEPSEGTPPLPRVTKQKEPA